ncbi:hypothetical protein D6D13_08340 [Aureobasidium pullulans]|uniref:Uncharacterized protein n=1 Tax=Aureobasidium pullulans TaxID=5580 RepID=A0A4S9C8X8_AURPU|nr:hypothetical protein D6D13_08340 [Aureobasidium pullulans]
MAAPPVLVGEDVAPAAVPEPDDDVVVMPAADELAEKEPEAELDTLKDDPSQQHALESNPTLSLNDGASVNFFAQGAGVSRLGSPSRRSSSRRSGRLNVRARSGRTTGSTGYADSQSESPNRFGSDAARDDSTVFDHDDSGSPVRNQRQEDHNQSISPPLSEARLSCGERPSDEALPAHGEFSGGIRRLSRSFSNFSLTDNRVVRSKTTGNLRPPFSLMRHHIRTGSQASQEELLPRGTIPGRSGGSLQVAVQLPLMPAILRAVLATFQVARHKVSVDKSLRSGTMHCPIATQPTLVEANLRPERLDLSRPHYLPLTLSSTLCFLSNHREPLDLKTSQAATTLIFYASDLNLQRQYDLAADLHRELEDEARDDGDQAPPVVPESADTNPDYTFESQNLAEEVIWRY